MNWEIFWVAVFAALAGVFWLSVIGGAHVRKDRYEYDVVWTLSLVLAILFTAIAVGIAT